MRKRQRHLNARAAGAALVLDARYIDQADGTSLSAWTDRSANAYTIDQPTTANQPTFETNEINGNPAVKFDGTNDYFGGGDILDLGTNSLTIVVVARRVSAQSGMFMSKIRQAGDTGRWWFGRDINKLSLFYQKDSSTSVSAAEAAETSTANQIFSATIQRGDVMRVFRGGVQGASTSTGTDTVNLNSTNVFLLGAFGNSTGTGPDPTQYYWNGFMSQVTVMLQATYSDPLRKRLERSAGYSFKIACS